MSSDAQRRLQKLRCGWRPVNRRVSREDPDRLKSCSACLPRVAVDHIFQCPCPARRLALKDLACRYVQDVPAVEKNDDILIKALHTGALSWIKGEEIPGVDRLNLPATTIWESLFIRRMLNRLPWDGIYFFEDSGGVGHRTMNSLSATGGAKIMVKVGQVEQRRGCSIWLGGCEMPMSIKFSLAGFNTLVHWLRH